MVNPYLGAPFQRAELHAPPAARAEIGIRKRYFLFNIEAPVAEPETAMPYKPGRDRGIKPWKDLNLGSLPKISPVFAHRGIPGEDRNYFMDYVNHQLTSALTGFL